MKKVCILSLRCAVGLQKEIESLSVGFARCGWQPHAILADGYRNLCTNRMEVDFIPIRRGYAGMLLDVLAEHRGGSLKRRLSALAPDLILFYNQSPLNLQVARYAKTRLGSKIGVCLHDPWKPQKLKYGVSYAVLYQAVERLQQRIVSQADWVLTLSPFGTEMFRSHYPKFFGCHSEGRILLKKVPPSARERSCISIIGRINRSTGHEEFMALAGQLRGLLTGVTFEIVTSSPVARKIEFLRHASANGVVVRYSEVLTEQEMEDAIARSICVFRLDQELTQSGVIPVCYRAGVPVVVRHIPGLIQHVLEGVTGFTYNPGIPKEKLVTQLEDMRHNPTTYAHQCHAAFSAGWSEDCFESYYRSALTRL